MRIEFAPRSDDSVPAQIEEPVGTARWVDGTVEIEAADPSVHETIERVFRPVPVGTDDRSYRRFGTTGTVLLQPGSFEWFRAAAFTRSQAEGLTARIVPGVAPGAGWDPAAQYRSFEASVEGFERAHGDA